MLKDNLKFLIENEEDDVELDDGTVVQIGDIKINVKDGELEYKVDVFYSNSFRGVQVVTLVVRDNEEILKTINNAVRQTMYDMAVEETRDNIKAIKNGLSDIKDNIEKLKENISKLYE